MGEPEGVQRESSYLTFDSSLMPYPSTPGFSTWNQLKQRNTLKDGIIMIQTLLIIVFIIVPIFLLLDKVPQGLGILGEAETRSQGRQDMGRVPIFSDSVAALLSKPSPRPVFWLIVHAVIPAWRLLLPLPSQTYTPGPTRAQGWRTLTP